MDQRLKIIAVVKKAQRVLVTTHYNPDADAVGSAISVALWLKSLKKKVIVVNEDKPARWLMHLPAIHLVKVAKTLKPFDYDLAIVLDCGDLERVGDVKKLLSADKPIINIDHHRSNPKFGTINLVNPKISSTSELVADLLSVAKFKLNKPVAHLLYAGIMTDTGSFKYDITTAATHALAARLMVFGINPARTHDQLYPGMPAKDMLLFTNMVHRSELFFDNRVYYAGLTREQLNQFSPEFDWKERLLSFLRAVNGVEVVMILSSLKDGRIRVNLRSQSDVDVSAICAQVGGGGHPKASGATLDMPLEQAKKKMLLLLKKALS